MSPGRWHCPLEAPRGCAAVPAVLTSSLGFVGVPRGVPAAVGAALFEGDGQGDALEVPGGIGDTRQRGGRGSVGPGTVGSPPALAQLATGSCRAEGSAPPCARPACEAGWDSAGGGEPPGTPQSRG